MPKNAIDYSKCLIYKICCLDTSITDIYVGMTTNYNKRKGQHKNECCNDKASHYNYYIYQFIRENGGWSNWEMIIIEQYPCSNNLEARKREYELIVSLGATLNKKIGVVGSLKDNDYSQKFYHRQLDLHPNHNQDKYKRALELNPNHNQKYYKRQLELHPKLGKKRYQRALELNPNLNKERYQKYESKKIVCECGKEITIGYKSTHLKTKYHLDNCNPTIIES